jgi:hypothetical protein
VTSETTTRAQDASVGEGLGNTPPELMVWLGRHAEQLTEWQHFVFNSSMQHPNRVGMADCAHHIQVAAYELRVMMGETEIDAKRGAGIPLSRTEQDVYDERLEELRRKESVSRFAEGLRG